MKEIVVVWFDDEKLRDDSLEFVRNQLEALFGEDGFLLLPSGVERVEVLK